MPRAERVILQVAPNDDGGGAESVARELHRAYRAAGLDAWLALGVDHDREPYTVAVPNTASRSAWARAVLGVAGLGDPASDSDLPAPVRRAARMLAEPGRYSRVLSGLEDFDAPGTSRLLGLTPLAPTLLHLHNLHGAYFDIRQLPALSRQVPIAITMHDAWLLTGHCVHPMDCPGWLGECDPCPYLDRYVPIPRDRAAENRRIKRDALTGARVHIATPSKWLMAMVDKCGLAGLVAGARVIPNGVDTGVFRPGDRAAARARLGLPGDALIAVFSAISAKTNPFKDFATLETALPAIARGVSGRRLLLLAVGQSAPDARIEGADVRFVPFVDDDSVMADHYRAADLYLHPARAENFPLAVLEAIACGAPVVASDVGGIPEIVVDGETGLLVPVGDSAALAQAAVSLLSDADTRARFSAAGVARVAEHFTLALQVDRYLAWYDELLAAGPWPQAGDAR
jgi:glycosyltransferase involved in cell wall biosynthesis